MTREQNLERLSKAIPKMNKRLLHMGSEDAIDGGGALLTLATTAWIPGRMTDEELQKMTDWIVALTKAPKWAIDEYLPRFQELWNTPVVQSIGKWAEKRL